MSIVGACLQRLEVSSKKIGPPMLLAGRFSPCAQPSTKYAANHAQSMLRPARGTIRSSKMVSRSVRVVTDIDDTVKSSGGVRLFNVPLGGIDTQYPRGAYYPGVFQFSLELSSNRLPSKTQAPEVAVLTARARELKCVLALNPQHPVCVRYNEAGKRNGRARWGIGDDYVFYGSVLEWLFQDRKGKRKYDNFRLLLEKDASRQCIVDYVLVGDTGERDEEAAERIIAEFGDRVRTVFLHVVTDQPTVAVPRDRLYRGVPFLYFRTYVGAAVKATLYGMLGVPALQRVMSAAQEELAPSSGCSRWRELEWDLEEARALVRTSSIPGSIQILQFLAKSPPGSFPVPEILGKGQRRKLVTV